MVLSTIIDLDPLFKEVIWPMLGVIALGVGTYFVNRFTKNMDEKTQQSIRVVVTGILQAGLQAAQAKVATLNIQHPNVQSAIVGDALNYASTHAPSALLKMGIDLSTPEGQKQVKEKLESMLAPAVMLAVSSPNDVSVATAATVLNPAIPTAAPAVPVADAAIGTDPAVVVAIPAVAGPIAQLTAGATPPKT